MSKTTRFFKNIILLGIFAAILFFAWYFFTDQDNSIEVQSGKIKDIKTMAQLCTVELYNEVVVNDTIGNKVLCGIQKQRGSVSFDLESLVVDNEGDTVKAILSPEIVEIYESTDNNAWEVVDMQDLRWYKRDKVNEKEENAIKRKIRDRSIRMLYHNGVIERARAEAVTNLSAFMEKVYHKPALVTDPTPKGAYYNRYK